MKSFKSYLVIAVFAVSTVFVPSAFSGTVKRVKGIDVIAECTACKPPVTIRQTAKANADGNLSVKLSEPGTYTIRYADGDKKGQVITTIHVKGRNRYWYVGFNKKF